MKVEVKTLAGATAGDVELDPAIFGVEERRDVLHRVVAWQLEKRRARARAAKERSDIALTGKKFGPQKGSGRARHGARSAPLFVGGGKAHGPRARDFNPSLNKKVRALGLKVALSGKAAAGKLLVLEDLALESGKTKLLKEQLAKLGVANGLFIDGDSIDPNFALASRNLYKVDVLPAVGANVYDILNHDYLVLTRAALGELEARFNG